jgi:hypothetical protein
MGQGDKGRVKGKFGNKVMQKSATQLEVMTSKKGGTTIWAL